jgi:hypothetical protein
LIGSTSLQRPLVETHPTVKHEMEEISMTIENAGEAQGISNLLILALPKLAHFRSKKWATFLPASSV